MTTKTKAAALFASLMLALPLVALAADIRASEKVNVDSSERINSNLYLAAGNVSSLATVTGDEIAAGGDVLVNGTISNDLLIAGGNVTVLANVGGDVRIVGGNITINGPVKGDVVIGAGQTNLSGPSIGGDVIWGGGELRIDSPVNGNLQLRGGDVTINAPVKGSITFKGGSLTLGAKAVVSGNLTYTTPDKVKMVEGSSVKGKVEYAPSPVKHSKGFFTAVATAAFLGKFLMTLACALVVGLIFKGWANDFVEGAVAQPLIELGRGFATTVALPIASIILLSTVIGVPLGVLGLLTFAGLLVFGSIAAPILVGSVVHKYVMRSSTFSVTWLTILIGVAVYMFVGLIPFLGWLIKFLLFMVTIGVTIKMQWDTAKNWR